MSIYRHKKTPFYRYDFHLQGHRFHGSTKRANRRDAEQVERAERDRAKQELTQAKAASVSLQINDVAGRYWTEVGTHHSGADNTWRDIGRLVEYFGRTKLLTDITDNDVAKLVAWRRGHRVIRGAKANGQECHLISNGTVNRSTTEVLKKLFTRAKTTWGEKFENEPNWRRHMLREPEERIRELVGDEAARLDQATRDDHAPFFAFAKLSGLRLSECLLRWSEVNWETRRIQKLGKGGKLVTAPITSEIHKILWPLQGHHPISVFTYVAQRTRKGRVKGQRYPLTPSGVKTAWRRLRSKAGIEDFRFHDLRHDLATKLLRETGNLKLVQRALNHRSLKTTLRYAHVLDQDVAEALERVNKSRNFSRSALRKVG